MPCAVTLAPASTVVTSCSGNSGTHPAPPTPASTGPRIPFTPIPRPLDTGRVNSDPCGLLDLEQLSQLDFGFPDDGAAGIPKRKKLGCAWNQATTVRVSVTAAAPSFQATTLTELAANHDKSPDRYAHWEESSLDGLPVIFSWRPGATEDCEAAVGTSTTEVLYVDFQRFADLPGDPPGKPRHWQGNPCGAAAKAAEFVIGKLRDGH
ncbi:DUF3558 domain-containing protein [Amycolatopsis sp. NPDC059021]|uniref:DUF3558 domain-containing protein n=1 Tax=Amycolatopsis sp. NPDC059021 TaxID=3346704 RepID=UPI00366D6A44